MKAYRLRRQLFRIPRRIHTVLVVFLAIAGPPLAAVVVLWMASNPAALILLPLAPLVLALPQIAICKLLRVCDFGRRKNRFPVAGTAEQQVGTIRPVRGGPASGPEPEVYQVIDFQTGRLIEVDGGGRRL